MIDQNAGWELRLWAERQMGANELLDKARVRAEWIIANARFSKLKMFYGDNYWDFERLDTEGRDILIYIERWCCSDRDVETLYIPVGIFTGTEDAIMEWMTTSQRARDDADAAAKLRKEQDAVAAQIAAKEAHDRKEYARLKALFEGREENSDASGLNTP